MGVVGHRRWSTVYKLTFDDTHGEELTGLEVTTRGASLGQLFDIAKLGKVDLHELLETGIDDLRGIYESFPSRIIDWNHQDEDGRPIPADSAHFYDEDYTFTLPVLVAWLHTIRADPKNASTIGLNQAPAEPDKSADDLSDLPMTITE